MKILCLGDVVGEEGTNLLSASRRLSKLRTSLRADLVIVNGENSAPGNGVSASSARELFAAGADVITGGNHSWRRHDVYTMLDDEPMLLRPGNFPAGAPGHGACIAEAAGWRVLVLNLAGCVYMEPIDSPFVTADRLLREYEGQYDAVVVDFHAEATSEKLALGRYLDGRISALFGTHTHVATADAQILPGGTGYITDVGMCGSHAGILGVDAEAILHKFTVKTPVGFGPAHGDCQLHGVLFEISGGRCTAVTPVSE